MEDHTVPAKVKNNGTMDQELRIARAFSTTHDKTPHQGVSRRFIPVTVPVPSVQPSIIAPIHPSTQQSKVRIRSRIARNVKNNRKPQMAQTNLEVINEPTKGSDEITHHPRKLAPGNIKDNHLN